MRDGGRTHVTKEEEEEGKRVTGATPALVRGMGKRSRGELLWAADDDDDDGFGVRCKVPVGEGANRA